MTKLEEKTKELVNTILETKEFKEYDKASKEFRNDKDATKLFQNFQKAQQELAIIIHGQFEGEEKQRKNVEKLLKEVKENKKINNWLEKQRIFEKLVGETAIEISNKLNFPFTLPNKCGRGCSC